MWLLFSITYSLLQICAVSGHGRLMNPPARNSMWRLDFPNPINYRDDELYCGGFSVQWKQNEGKCGVCGDSWNEPTPRLHESGGFYDTGLIGGRYAQGQIIDVNIELTANHQGYFELRLCPLSTDSENTEDQDCFDRYPLYLEGQSTSRFTIPEGLEKKYTFKYRVKLPDEVTCSRCVIQWTYVTANSWDDCGNGTGAVGCGRQETFKNCADIAIVSKDEDFGSTEVVPATSTTLHSNPDIEKIINATQINIEENTLVVRPQVCVARGNFKNRSRFDSWCMTNCLKNPSTCPEKACKCLSECVPTGDFARGKGANAYCRIHCLRYPQSEHCPDWCRCT